MNVHHSTVWGGGVRSILVVHSGRLDMDSIVGTDYATVCSIQKWIEACLSIWVDIKNMLGEKGRDEMISKP